MRALIGLPFAIPFTAPSTLTVLDKPARVMPGALLGCPPSPYPTETECAPRCPRVSLNFAPSSYKAKTFFILLPTRCLPVTSQGVMNATDPRHSLPREKRDRGIPFTVMATGDCTALQPIQQGFPCPRGYLQN